MEMEKIEETEVFSCPNSEETKDVEVKREDETQRNISIGGAIFHPLSTSMDVFNWATDKVDKSVVTPLSDHISHSVINPNVLASLVWMKIKDMTPQRARDVSRILSVAISNSWQIYTAKQGVELANKNKELGNKILAAVSSPSGQEVVKDGVASVVKVAEAFNTPESKEAAKQITSTVLSFFNLMASPEGKEVILGLNESYNKFCETAASPETGILLAELGSNICHALQVENEQWKKEKTCQENSSILNQSGELGELGETSPASCSLDEGGSNIDLPKIQAHEAHNGSQELRFHNACIEQKCTSIESDILIRMGVSKEVAVKFQNEIKQKKNILDNQNMTKRKISSENEAHSDVILPAWHTDEVRHALRRRHRNKFDENADRSKGLTNKISEKFYGAYENREALKSDQSSIAVNSIEAVICKILSITILVAICIFLLVILYALFKLIV